MADSTTITTTVNTHSTTLRESPSNVIVDASSTSSGKTKSNQPRQHRPRKQPKEQSKEKSKERSKAESKAELKAETKAETKDQAKDQSKDQTRDQIDDRASSNRESRKPASKRDKPQGKKKNATQKQQQAQITKNRPQGRLTECDESEEAGEAGHSGGQSSSRRRRRGGLSNKKSSQGQTSTEANQDDLTATLSRDLRSGQYECMVCWDIVRPAHPTWSCDCCWAVFHLGCVQKWAEKSLTDTSTNRPTTSWRCPGCQHTRNTVPSDYFCFCGKHRNPDLSRYLTPHSCGQLCKKSRDCPHGCVLPCHPGPCPPCTAMGPTLSCFCGSESRQARCVETDYTTRSFACTKVCGELLGCGKHTCTSPCHSGLCPPCDVEEDQLCFCGKESRKAICGSVKGIYSRDHVGSYACESTCQQFFDCNEHSCQKPCHPKDDSTQPLACPFDPRHTQTCPCGATPIEIQREKCTDPIPTCNSSCSKILPCGHTCAEPCHLGKCPPCRHTVDVPCRCRSTNFKAMCSEVDEDSGGTPPLCDRVCRGMRNCGRHACGNTCCLATKQKGVKRSPIMREQAEAAHECPLTCGRTLSCGEHTCQEQCHKGPCQPCLEAVFEEMACHCGRTVLEPPIRCGVKLPPCPHPCTRPTTCGHLRLLNHNCHPDSESCPPCAMLVTRTCVCGKTELKNVPCYREAPRCGRVCDNLLPCGRHRCLKSCHRGPCLDEDELCTQKCTGKRERCGHGCTSKCHGSTPCPEVSPCPALIRVSCKCGQHSLQIPCNATAESSGSKRELACNDFCAKVERNRKLAQALEIDEDREEPALTTDDLGYYDDTLCEYYVDNSSTCKQVESMLIGFCNDKSKQTLHCKPMKSHLRRFVHRYCVHFNLATEAVDPEPFRSVVIRKTLGDCRIPTPLLSVAAHHPLMNRPPPPVADGAQASKNKPPVNAICLSDLKFGLIKTELDMELKQVFGEHVKYTSEWMTDADAVLIKPELSEDMDATAKEEYIWHLKKQALDALVASETAARVDCCWIDRTGKMTWSERKTVTPPPLLQKGTATPVSANPFDTLQEES